MMRSPATGRSGPAAHLRACLVLTGIAGTAAAGPVKVYFTQPFPGSVPLYGCNGMSADGRTAVGWVDNPLSMFMFDIAWLLTPCSTVPLRDLGFGGYAHGASNSAQVVVGSIINPLVGGGAGVAVRWDAPAYTYTVIPTLGGVSAHANAITPDGNVIVGWSQDTAGRTQGFFSVMAGPPVGVGRLIGFNNNFLMAVAPDASAAVGYAQGTAGTRAMWFRPGAGLALLPNPSGGVFLYAVSVSQAPNLVVGWGTIGATTLAMLSDGVTTIPLGTLPGDTSSLAHGISPDGSVITGVSNGVSSSSLTISRTFVLSAATGMIDLQATVSGTFGYSFGPWWLAEGKSTSGLHGFAGTAVNTITGDYAGYLIQLCPADFDRDGVTDLNDFAPFVAAFNAGSCEADLNSDGLLNSGDYTEFFNSMVTGC